MKGNQKKFGLTVVKQDNFVLNTAARLDLMAGLFCNCL